MTPPFFPERSSCGSKTRPIFFAGAKGELSEKILELWRDGKRDGAAKLLIDLLTIEGWTQEQWARLESPKPLWICSTPTTAAKPSELW